MDLDERQLPLKYVLFLHESIQLPKQQFSCCSLADSLIFAGFDESAFEGGLVPQNLLVFSLVLSSKVLH